MLPISAGESWPLSRPHQIGRKSWRRDGWVWMGMARMALKRGNYDIIFLSRQQKNSQAHQWARQVVDRQHTVASPFHQNLVQIMQSADSWFGSFARVFQFTKLLIHAALRRQVAVNSINQPSNHGKPLHGMWWCSPQFSDKLNENL